jgi:hypothetical protein
MDDVDNRAKMPTSTLTAVEAEDLTPELLRPTEIN